MVSVLESINVVEYIYLFMSVEPFLHLWDDVNLFGVDDIVKKKIVIFFIGKVAL